MDNSLNNANVLITGATGFIGRNLVAHILKTVPTCRIIAVAHSGEKAKKLFHANDRLAFIEADVNKPVTVDREIDYIIHAASITSSKSFVDEPVDTILTSTNGTMNMLELARQKRVKGFVFLSSMEVYGAPATDDSISEDKTECNIDTMQKRSSYPESKRLCEALCCAYCAQYDIPAKVVRLTQTIGQGIEYNDGRVFAEFARCAIENRDIVLHTKGLTRRSYISVNDAVKAIITVMLHGQNGTAYNAANEATYCSIAEMAHLVADDICKGSIRVIVKEEAADKFGYAPELRMNLGTSRLQALGWQPGDSLKDMYAQLISSMKNNRGI